MNAKRDRKPLTAPPAPLLDADEALQIFRFLQGKRPNQKVLRRVLKDKLHAEEFLSPTKKPLLCATPLVTAAVGAALRSDADPRLRAAHAALRDRPPGNWLRFQTANFDLYYTLDPGPNQITDVAVTSAEPIYSWTPSGTGGRFLGCLDPASGIPRYVQKMGFFFEDALGVYLSLGFLKPNTPVQAYLTMPPPGAGGYTYLNDSVIWISPILATDEAMEYIVAHELFHVIQCRYYNDPTGAVLNYWYEGSAYVAMDFVGGDWCEWAPATVGMADQSLLKQEWASALFWKYMMDQLTAFRDPADSAKAGSDVQRCCWEAAQKNNAANIDVLGAALTSLAPQGVTFAKFGVPQGVAIAASGIGPRDLLSNETLWGNWHAASYLRGLGNPFPDSRFDYQGEDKFPFPIQPVVCHDTAPGDTPVVNLDPWAVDYRKVTLDSAGPLSVSITASPSAGPGDPDGLVQLLILDANGVLLDIIRTTSANYQRIIGSPYGSGKLMGTPKTVVAILATRSVAASFACSFQMATAAPDLMITRWNSPAGCEYQSNWHDAPWTGGTPDIWVKPVKGIGFSSRGKRPYALLYVRVRNKGNAAAGPVIVKLSMLGNKGHWQPVSPLSFQNIRANSEAVASVRITKPLAIPDISLRGWRPRPPRVFATIVAADDSSPDNNTALSTIPIPRRNRF